MLHNKNNDDLLKTKWEHEENKKERERQREGISPNR